MNVATAPSPLELALQDHTDRLERLLEDLLSDRLREFEIGRPASLLTAMRHGALDGGKRLRPFLVKQSAALFGEAAEGILRVGAAIECVHCYSLIHDDLPAMDDDRTRRGKPTVHVAHGEASAILAGDALLTLAFDILADEATALPDAAARRLLLGLARASGLGGMAGGQALDLGAETRDSPLDVPDVEQLQAMKTGALLRFSCEAGAIAAGASEDDIARLRRFGEVLGLAFQIQDDLLDQTADAATLGKAAGKDAARGKATLPSIHGIEWSRRRLADLVDEAAALLEPYGERADMLLQTTRFIAERDR